MHFWCIAVTVLAASIASHVPQPSGPAARLAEAEARWEARKPRAYSFSIDVRCECVRPGGVPPTFHVTESEARALPDLDPAARRFYDYYNTVEKLFAIIRRSIADGGYRIVVEYDAELGYPVWADLDPKSEVADDELSFRVTRFRR